MSAALMMPPHLKCSRYGVRGPFDRHLTPAQRRRVRHDLRRIYGMTHAERQCWIAYWAGRGVKIP